MLAGRNKSIKSQHILLLLKILVIKNKSWRRIDLAHDLNISPSEITMGLERLRISGLIDSEKSKPHKSAILEFLINGLKFDFPVQFGTLQRGIKDELMQESISGFSINHPAKLKKVNERLKSLIHNI